MLNRVVPSEKKPNDREQPSLEDLKKSPNPKNKDAIAIAQAQLSHPDFVDYINSNIHLVGTVWQHRAEFNFQEKDWLLFASNHFEFAKKIILDQAWSAESIFTLAKINIVICSQLLAVINSNTLSGKQALELINLYPHDKKIREHLSKSCAAAIEAYKELINPKFLIEAKINVEETTFTNMAVFGMHLNQLVAQINHLFRLAQLSNKEKVSYFTLHPKMASTYYICSRASLTEDEWIDIAYNLPQLAIKLAADPYFFGCADRFMRLAKISKSIAIKVIKHNGSKVFNDAQKKELINFYDDKAITSLLKINVQPAQSDKSSGSFLIFKLPPPNYFLMWQDEKTRKTLTEWDWTFLAMRNTNLAQAICESKDCKNWSRFNLNCLATLNEKFFLDILKLETEVSFTGFELLDLSLMYANKGFKAILEDSCMIKKVFSAITSTPDEVNFGLLGNYYLDQNYLSQAIACYKKGIETDNDTTCYQQLSAIEDLSTSDLNFYLEKITQAIAANTSAKLIAVQSIFRARLFEITEDSDYKSSEWRETEEAAALAESDRIWQEKEDNYHRNICKELCRAAEWSLYNSFFETTRSLTDIKEFICNSPGSDIRLYLSLTNSIIAFERANDASAEIAIESEVLAKLKTSKGLSDYLAVHYPAFHQKFTLQYPKYTQSAFYASPSTIENPILIATIENVKSSNSEGNRFITNADL